MRGTRLCARVPNPGHSALTPRTPITRLERTNRRDVVLPQPVLAEIAYGIARLQKSKRRSLLQERFDLIAGTLGRLEWTDKVSEAFGSIKATLERKGLRIEDFDVAIAAHAVALEGILVTDNTKDMGRVPGLEIESWSE
jgi:tRNA(fMet)-specific endonuclease VapC